MIQMLYTRATWLHNNAVKLNKLFQFIRIYMLGKLCTLSRQIFFLFIIFFLLLYLSSSRLYYIYQQTVGMTTRCTKNKIKLLRSYEYTQLYGVSVAVDTALISAYIKLYKCTLWDNHWSSKMSTHPLHKNILHSKERIKIVQCL